MSAPNGVPDDDTYWQRPDPDQKGPAAAPARTFGRAPQYSGPPRTDPPPASWRPPMVPQLPPPRSMPAQNMDAVDDEERSARTVTYGIGLVAGAIGLILMCLLCARVLF